MTEKLLQFIWAFGYFNKSSLLTVEGEQLTLLAPGSLNKNQGPDFLNAKVQIGNTTFFGSVELHLQTSGWEKHKHERDRQYNNVILHVVYRHDKTLRHSIPVLELEPRISSLLLEQYEELMNSSSGIPCGKRVRTLKELSWLSWKERLLAERLAKKAALVLESVRETNYHWEESFWRVLARNFGGKINGDAFEAMAKSIPVNLLAKHKASIHQLEALLLGQANLLDEGFTDDYPRLLQREYRFLKTKYTLLPSPVAVLFLRMRPGAFPTIRLAQLAALLHQASHLFSKILEAENVAEIKSLFAVTANDFWHYHYSFQKSAEFKTKNIGLSMVENILINTVVPLLFAYGIHHNNNKFKIKALRWLEQLAPEANAITKEFLLLGVENNSAYDSQALIELKNHYCNNKRCLECAVGNNILREAAAEYGRLKALPAMQSEGE